MKKTFKPVFCKIPANVILSKTLMSNTTIDECSIAKIPQLLQLIMLTLFSCFPLGALTAQTCSSCCWNGKRCWCGTRPRHRWHRCPKTCWTHCLSLGEDPAPAGTAGGEGQRHGLVVTRHHGSAVDLVPPAI